MKAGTRHTEGKRASELIEEAVHLLRGNTGGVLAAYYIGSLPFVLGLLYFWADMSRSPFAPRHVAEAALGVGALFVWMKGWQAWYARRLLDILTGHAAPLTWRWCVHAFIAQAVLQPTALFLVPLASIPILPLAWVYAFYQNATVFGAEETGSLRGLVRRAGLQAALWPRQNHAVLAILGGFALVVFFNWITVALLCPLALKTLFGVESIFSRSPLSMLNTTFFAVMAGLTYLCVDPLIKAAYALRCFYGESLSSGADLRAELRLWAAPGPALALLLLPAGCPGRIRPASANRRRAPVRQPRAPPASRPNSWTGQSPKCCRNAEYTWRMPREKVVEPEPAQKGIIGRFVERALDTVKNWGTKFAGWLGRILRKLFGPQRQVTPAPSGFAWMNWLYLLIYALVAAALVGVFLLARNMIRSRRIRRGPGSRGTDPTRGQCGR